MSQEQPRRESGTNFPDVKPVTEPVKYGDVLNVSGELADQPIAPRDAALMQSAESQVLGRTQKGGVAATMQSAATLNQEAGYVGPTEYSAAAGGRGMKVTESDIPGRLVVTESVGGQVVGRFTTPVPEPSTAVTGSFAIGDALEAAGVTCGDKPVTQSDAGAIQAAEVRATGRSAVTPGGVAATAMSAADVNDRTGDELQKITLGEVLVVRDNGPEFLLIFLVSFRLLATHCLKPEHWLLIRVPFVRTRNGGCRRTRWRRRRMRRR